MDNAISLIIESKNKLFFKNKKYIIENDWSTPHIFDNDKSKKKQDDYKAIKESIKYKQKEFKLQNEVVAGMLLHLSRLLKKIAGTDVTEEIQEFLDNSLEIIEMHTNRVDSYIDNIDISEIPNMDVRADELQFHNEISKEVELLQDKITTLGLRSSKIANTMGIDFLRELKAPLSMHWILSEIYPDINKKLEERGIDIDAEPLDNGMLIYNEDVPKWDSKLHYWEQKKETLVFYASEFKKIKDGIVIDGYYISGWMYYHMNVFVTPIPHKVLNKKSGQYESKDKIINPPLRDSDVLVFENHELQKKTNTLFMFIAATRRVAKTTLEASKLGHAATIGKKELLCASSTKKDLNQISKNFRIDLQYKNPAFAVFNVSNDWTDKVELGLKTKSNKTILLSTVNIVNTDGGNNVEILAGYTPDEFIYDEAMKGKFIEALQGLVPALKGAEGMTRCFGILTATGGDEVLSKDGITVINDPVGNSMLPMQWDLLERGVPDNCKTWEEDKQKPFTTFIPGQMCVDMPKFDSTLAHYIGRTDSEELKKIKIKITDWNGAVEKIANDRAKVAGNRVAYNKQVVYIPIKPTDIMMSGKESPFTCVAEAKAHKEYLISSGKWDARRELYKDSQGRIQIDISTKELAPFPFNGSNIDAPFLIFEDPPTEKVKWGTYTAGFDDYKHDSAEKASLSTFYVWKNEIIGDPFSKKIVASIAIRPDRHSSVHEKWLLLMEAYQLEGTCFGENEDFTIKEFLDRRHLTEKYLATALDFTQTFTLPNALKRKFGWTPQSSKKLLFSLFVDYCNEPFIVEHENGKIEELKGVQRIDDIWLLEEIIQYTENQNVDRIIGAMGGHAFMHYLLSSFRWKVKEKQAENKKTEVKKQTHREKSFYRNSKSSSGFYRGIK